MHVLHCITVYRIWIECAASSSISPLYTTRNAFLELEDYGTSMMHNVFGLRKPMPWQNHVKNISVPRQPKSV